jgi:putative SOS response-associated peptidase YedK
MCGRVATPKTNDILKAFDLVFNGPEVQHNINLKPADEVLIIASNNPNEMDYKK